MITIDLLISFVLVLIMFGIGMSLTLRAIQEVFLKPKALLVSLTSQMVLLPIIAFTICFNFDLPLYIQIGLILLIASPGGTTAGFITYLFNGNVALSIVLTSINSILTIFSIPIIVNLALTIFYGKANEFHLPFFATMREIFIVTLLPVSIGIIIRQTKEKVALLLEKFTKPVSIVLLGIVFLLKFIGTESETGISKQEVKDIIPYAILLNIVCLLVGYLIAVVFKLGVKNKITISTESAVHNTTIAFLVAGSLLHQPDFGKVALVYAMFSFWTAVFFSWIIFRQNRNQSNNS
ncbi:MAG: bile acid:sodium symporter [Crocinitomicaceae bacterium]|nr:bile acid:sodium symporter [Crocinitomicaceae bacterium]